MLDFDELKKLAEDPEAIEEYRKQVVEDFINSLPEDRQHKARQFQFRIMAQTRHIKNPLSRATAMYDMMVESVCQLHGMMKGGILDGKLPETGPKRDASILDLGNFRQEKLDKSDSD